MTAAELAEACEIPAGNVPTIVNMLSRAGILSCSPGRSGGCSLARSAADISALEIIEALEGPLEISHCLLDSRRCHDKDPECAVHHAWSEGRDAAIAALATTSLADAIERERRDRLASSPDGAERAAPLGSEAPSSPGSSRATARLRSHSSERILACTVTIRPSCQILVTMTRVSINWGSDEPGGDVSIVTAVR